MFKLDERQGRHINYLGNENINVYDAGEKTSWENKHIRKLFILADWMGLAE